MSIANTFKIYMKSVVNHLKIDEEQQKFYPLRRNTETCEFKQTIYNEIARENSLIYDEAPDIVMQLNNTCVSMSIISRKHIKMKIKRNRFTMFLKNETLVNRSRHVHYFRAEISNIHGQKHGKLLKFFGKHYDVHHFCRKQKDQQEFAMCNFLGRKGEL
ncbi:hypothetical protein RF11_10308 [Thelohanellus kitauei]|uniref:Uncharacterized protein n=1 Tax=Thelohanellus kitauei TaxID=669202 RepID=A0A0C2IK60_THEKT|nr:hypothetical protein RF11_10308 [Thelohanellus kitauei]